VSVPSAIIDNRFAHVQAADAQLVDIDDAQARAPDGQAPDDQATDGEPANCDRSERKSADREAAYGLSFGGLGADRQRADACRPCASRWQVLVDGLLHLAFVRPERAAVHSVLAKRSVRAARRTGRFPQLTHP
jgi:hypothetical protein